MSRICLTSMTHSPSCCLVWCNGRTDHLLLFRCSRFKLMFFDGLKTHAEKVVAFYSPPSPLLLLLRLLTWYYGLHQQHAFGHCILAVYMCNFTLTRTTMQKYKWKMTHSIRRRGYKWILNFCFAFIVDGKLCRHSVSMKNISNKNLKNKEPQYKTFIFKSG